MNEIRRIAEELRLLFEGPSWLGPAIDPLLADISPEKAAQKPLAGVHSISELVLHMETWLRVARLRLTASTPIDPKEDENWPRATGTWQDAVCNLQKERIALQKAILEFPIERLDESAPSEEPQTFYVLLHGVIQHSAYHAGQIAILKKEFLAPVSADNQAA